MVSSTKVHRSRVRASKCLFELEALAEAVTRGAHFVACSRGFVLCGPRHNHPGHWHVQPDSEFKKVFFQHLDDTGACPLPLLAGPSQDNDLFLEEVLRILCWL